MQISLLRAPGKKDRFQKVNARPYPAYVIPAILIAAMGLALSIASHIASLLGIAILTGDEILGVHAGNIVVWIPVLLVARRMTGNATRSGGFKTALSGCPTWVKYALKGLFAYAMLSCLYFLATGRPFTNFTAAIRAFSGVWMLSYGAALALLYSAAKAPHSFQADPVLGSR